MKKIRYLLPFFIVTLCAVSWANQKSNPQCDLLSDGVYKLNFTFNSTERPSTVKISKNEFSQLSAFGDTLKGKIIWIYDCYLMLKVNGSLPDTSSVVAKTLYKSFGENCIQLEKKNGDSVFFRTTYTGNVHVTINKGYFIRLK